MLCCASLAWRSNRSFASPLTLSLMTKCSSIESAIPIPSTRKGKKALPREAVASLLGSVAVISCFRLDLRSRVTSNAGSIFGYAGPSRNWANSQGRSRNSLGECLRGLPLRGTGAYFVTKCKWIGRPQQVWPVTPVLGRQGLRERLRSPDMAIVLFTDFGSQDPYVGQVKAVLARDAPGVPQVDLLNDVPVYNVRAAAHLLAY